MTERELPGVDSAPACPFVAFEDDRETRSTSPDHRHRCYAELVPSPRAAAHQEAYCLSSTFPVCPTFQDWARREAAHARGEGDRPRSAPMAQPETAEAAAASQHRDVEPDAGELPRHPSTEEPPIRRNPPRDWAAPPPWAPGGAGAGPAGSTRRPAAGDQTAAPGFGAGRADESQGLVGSAADRLTARPPASRQTGGTPAPSDTEASAAPDEELAGLVVGRRVVQRPHDYPPPSPSARRPSVSSTRPSHRERDDAITGPSWERSRRYEAYPTIRARTGLPAPPRLAVLAGALVIAAVALFFLPALLGVGGGGGGGGGDGATPSPGAGQGAPTASPQPTGPPEPTQQVYLIEADDTLSKVATSFGLSLAELLAANPLITDPDKVAIGDEIIIPLKPPDEFTEPSPSAS